MLWMPPVVPDLGATCLADPVGRLIQKLTLVLNRYHPASNTWKSSTRGLIRAEPCARLRDTLPPLCGKQ